MDPYVVLGYLLLGAFLGAIGQGIRVIVGIAKTVNQAAAFNQRRLAATLGLALLVGVIAGALGVLDIIGKEITRESILTLISVGYAGTDFIEGLLRRQ